MSAIEALYEDALLQIKNLRAINAELLEGLCEIKSQMHNLPRSATADYVERTASDLIAKAKGE